jgi:iron complex outermembrane receptor protein
VPAAAMPPSRRDRSQWCVQRAAGAVAIVVAGATEMACAQERAVPQLDPIVVTATRSDERSFDLPLAIDSVDRDRIQNGQLQVNLSESLAGIPGISVQNRWNYAQDLQLSVRGFGARANFGVRGIRLYQDYIPATMPDGQGQTGSFSLVSAQRIEVLRGPFSSLYGNASGGVISVFTEDGPAAPIAGGQVIGGSYATWNAIAKTAGQSGAVNYVLAGNYFTIDGYRDHSHASRELGNAKIRLDASPDTSIVVVANALDQPEAEDPLGLTRAQWEANPRQADPAAVLFDTRKTVSQRQAGATVLQRLGGATELRVTGYGGTRTVRQFLAFPGTGPASSGGVSDIDRSFGGVDGRLIYRFLLGGGRGTVTLGGNYESQRDQRKGYVNNAGMLGDLRRDETDTVSNGDGYAQLELAPLDALSVLAGYRYSNVRFNTTDHYIATGNPDDSGHRNYSHGSPVVGAVWHVTDRLNVYGNYGQGFETPTFIELAYRPVGSGLNLALQPSVSDSAEAGLKALIGRTQRVNLAIFDVRTKDEIVVDTAIGGRTTYRNAARTERKGVEAAWQGDLGAGFAGYASYTYLSAKFTDQTTTGLPPQIVPAGARLPGVPGTGAYGELSWSYPQAYGLNAAVEVQYAGKVYVNDRNTDAAPRWTVANLRIGFEQRAGAWVFREFARLNNLGDVNYAGTVIVGDANGRYFEPSATRNFLLGLSAYATF